MAGKKRIHKLAPADQNKVCEVFKSVSHDILFEPVEVGGLLSTTTYTPVERGW